MFELPPGGHLDSKLDSCIWISMSIQGKLLDSLGGDPPNIFLDNSRVGHFCL